MEYIGGELGLFAAASNWKSYLAAQMRPFIRGRVLEVGAGIGGNIPFLLNEQVTQYLALEPDGRLAAAIQPDAVRLVAGTLTNLAEPEMFDTILYIDVLEHIADDRGEISRASCHLAPGGHLIVVSPAHQFLFSPFDRSIGHERRYDRRALSALSPASCQIVRTRMLDSAGFLLSLGNRVVMRSPMPTKGQIWVWDKVFVPASRCLDRLTGFRFGKSILMVWTFKAPAE